MYTYLSLYISYAYSTLLILIHALTHPYLMLTYIVGNTSFKALYNSLVPDSFRVAVDGDIVCSVPKYGYYHVGT